jgi:type IV secretory pathway VirB4 component
MAQKNDMQSGNMSGGKVSASTQSYLDVAEIKENTIIMKDGSLRAVLAVSSTNFSLKSTQEQNSLIDSYQGFINSLDFPIQILMQSRKLDIGAYLDKLRLIMQQQTNELLRMQTQEYIEYIGKLVEFASIMNKTFYVVIPLSTAAAKKGLLSMVGGLFSPGKQISQQSQSFEVAREQLNQRANHVISGLSGLGSRVISLTTEELIELLYNSYNLSTSSPIQIKNIDELELSSNKNNR